MAIDEKGQMNNWGLMDVNICLVLHFNPTCPKFGALKNSWALTTRWHSEPPYWSRSFRNVRSTLPMVEKNNNFHCLGNSLGSQKTQLGHKQINKLHKKQKTQLDQNQKQWKHIMHAHTRNKHAQDKIMAASDFLIFLTKKRVIELNTTMNIILVTRVWISVEYIGNDSTWTGDLAQSLGDWGGVTLAIGDDKFMKIIFF